MAKKVGIEFDREHFSRIEMYVRKIQQLYLLAGREASAISEGIKFDDSKPFTFEDYPQTRQKIDKMIHNMSNQMQVSIQDMSRKEWLAACYKNEVLIDHFASKVNIPKTTLEKYKSRNLEALSAFQERKLNGLNLSDRVWRYTNQFKGELELALDLGLGEGKSAAQLSRDIRSYLQDPDKLFRRVRDKHGNLHLSKNAQKYQPGPGLYRSSYKNAMRLTRTEVNMAYRKSDHEMNKKLDFVVGFEVRRSNNYFACDLCESLKGKYPKTFIFVGWHPQCRCHCISVTSTQEEFIEHQKKLLAGEDSVLKSKNEVSEVPDNFKQWVTDNKDRLEAAKSKPYFITDNGSLVDSRKNGYVPARTIEEAELFVINGGYANKANYKGATLEQANELNRTLQEVHKGEKLEEIMFGGDPYSSHGAYNTETNSIRINPICTTGDNSIPSLKSERYYRKLMEFEKRGYGNLDDFEKIQFDNFKVRYEESVRSNSGNGSVRHIFIHEYGHKLDYQNRLAVLHEKDGIVINRSSASTILSKEFRDVIPANQTEWIRKNVSDYATVSTREAFAEMYLMRMTGQYLPKEIEMIIDKILKNAK